MSELVRGAGELVRRSSGDLVSLASVAKSTEHVAFAGRHPTWVDFSAATMRAARRRSQLVAEDVSLDPWLLQAGPGAYQLATGWRVHEDAVVLARVRRPLGPPGQGRRPVAGPWEHLQVAFADVAGSLRRRGGLVPVTVDDTPEPTGSASVRERAHESAAAEAWRYLPRRVRDAAERLVPEPEVWLGQIVQQSDANGVPLSQCVRVLRMSATRAVAVLADRSLSAMSDRARSAGIEERRALLARTPWVVEQVGGDLAASVPTFELGGTGPAPLG